MSVLWLSALTVNTATWKKKGINVRNPTDIGTNIWRVKDGSLVASLPNATANLFGQTEAVGVWNIIVNPAGDILAVGDGMIAYDFGG